jgi:phage terminase small subunit
MLSKAKVKERIAELTRKIEESTMITAEQTLEEFAKIGFLQLDVRKLFDEFGRPIPVQDLDDAAAAQIASIKVRREWRDVTPGEKGAPASFEVLEYKLRPVSDKKAALDSIARHLGMFKDTVKLEINPIRELMEYISNNPKPLPAKP